MQAGKEAVQETEERKGIDLMEGTGSHPLPISAESDTVDDLAKKKKVKVSIGG